MQHLQVESGSGLVLFTKGGTQAKRAQLGQATTNILPAKPVAEEESEG